MTSDQNNTELSSPNTSNIDNKEDSLDAKSIKDMILNTISSPDTIKALAEVLNVVNKPENNVPEDNRLQATKDQDKKAQKDNEDKDREQKLLNWYNLQKQIESLPYTHEDKKTAVLKTLEQIAKDATDKSKDLSINRASSLAKMAVLKTELDIKNDKQIKYHPKFNQIKDLYERSNVEAGIIVAEDVLEDTYIYTTNRMMAIEEEKAEAEKAKLNQYNKDEGLSYELDLKNIPLADAIKYRLHGANRYNPRYKNLTRDDYLQISRNKQHDYNVHAIKRDRNREINALVI